MTQFWHRISKGGRYHWLEYNIYSTSPSTEFKIFTDSTTFKRLDMIGVWCQDNLCGQRMSFNQFRFRTESQLTAFLLKWS